MGLTSEWARAWVIESARVIAENRVELTALDRPIGDGDHGENMNRGFPAVMAKVDDVIDGTPADLFKLVASSAARPRWARRR